jgi:hypothetical protein
MKTKAELWAMYHANPEAIKLSRNCNHSEARYSRHNETHVWYHTSWNESGNESMVEIPMWFSYRLWKDEDVFEPVGDVIDIDIDL